jgi:hypothetical protein
MHRYLVWVIGYSLLTGKSAAQNGTMLAANGPRQEGGYSMTSVARLGRVPLI